MQARLAGGDKEPWIVTVDVPLARFVSYASVVPVESNFITWSFASRTRLFEASSTIEDGTYDRLVHQTSPLPAAFSSPRNPLPVVWYGLTVGKLVDPAEPPKYAFPEPSTAIAPAKSWLLPPTNVAKASDVPIGLNFATKASP